MRTLTWACGLTTVPARRNGLLPRTLASLAQAGFPEVRLFVDGDWDAAGWQAQFGQEVTCRPAPNVRTFGNWMLSLWELYIRNPTADRFALFQDDFVCCRGLRPYLERTTTHEKAYWNLFTMPSNETLASGPGWFRARSLSSGPPGFQTGRGAVALVFTREGVLELLSSRHLAERPLDAHRGWRAADGAIVTAMNKVGWSEFCHFPSLTQHLGKDSVMGNKPHKPSESFRGEEWDVRGLLG